MHWHLGYHLQRPVLTLCFNRRRCLGPRCVVWRCRERRQWQWTAVDVVWHHYTGDQTQTEFSSLRRVTVAECLESTQWWTESLHVNCCLLQQDISCVTDACKQRETTVLLNSTQCQHSADSPLYAVLKTTGLTASLARLISGHRGRHCPMWGCVWHNPSWGSVSPHQRLCQPSHGPLPPVRADIAPLLQVKIQLLLSLPDVTQVYTRTPSHP